MRILTGLCIALLLIGIVSWGKISAHSSDNTNAKTAPPATATPAPSVTPDQAKQKRLLESFGKLPLSFEANQGQVAAPVKFTSRGRGYSLFLTATEAVFQLRNSDCRLRKKNRNPMPATARESLLADHPTTNQSAIRNPQSAIGTSALLRMRLVGANAAPRVEGLVPRPGKTNYLSGSDPNQWHTNIPSYAQVRYHEVWPGVDVVWYGDQQQLKYDVIVAPGINPAVIRLAFDGARKVRVDAQGDLVVSAANGQEIRHHKPVIYQEVDGVRKEIAGRYMLRGNRQVGFAIAKYDASKPLVIDPVLIYSTYLGGSNLDEAYGVAVDAAGFVYVAGITKSTNFPQKPIALTKPDANESAFVTKLSPTGSEIVYSTVFLGGSKAKSIAVDQGGNVCITGSSGSNSSGPNTFPTTPNALQTSSIGTTLFLTKLNAAGNGLIYSTFLGASDFDSGSNGIAVDAAGNMYVTGSTSNVNFPTTVNAYQRNLVGGRDAFLAKFAPNTSLLSDNFDRENNGQCATGYSSFANWTVSSSTVNLIGAGCTNLLPGHGAYPNLANKGAITSKTSFELAPGSYNLEFDLAGSGNNQPGSITVRLGTAFNETFTLDSAAAFQTIKRSITVSAKITAPLIFETPSGATAGLALDNVRLVRADYALAYSTLLGGSNPNGRGNENVGTSIAVDSLGMAYVTGYTQSSNFPTTPGAYRTTAYGGGLCFDGNGVRFNCRDAFVAKLNPTASTSAASLIYSTYLGSPSDNSSVGGEDFGYGIAVDAGGNAYVTGYTYSTNLLGFPTTTALQSLGPGYHSFVTKFNAAGSGLVYSSLLPASFGYGIAVDSAGQAYVTGASGSGFPVTPDAFQPQPNGYRDAFLLKLSQNGNNILYSTLFGGSGAPPPLGGDTGLAIALDAIGDAYIAGYTNTFDFPTRFPLQPTYGGGQDAFVAKFGFAAQSQLTIAGVGITKGGNTGTITIPVIGGGFSAGTKVVLKRAGQPDIVGTVVSVDALGRTLTVSFDLKGATPGACDVVVTNPDSTSGTLKNGFTIEQGGAPQVWVDVMGRSLIRGGRGQTYFLQYGNRGEVDADLTLIFVSFPKYLTWGPVEGYQPITTGETENGDTFLSFEVAGIPAKGAGTIPLILTVPDDSKLGHLTFDIQAWPDEIESITPDEATSLSAIQNRNIITAQSLSASCPSAKSCDAPYVCTGFPIDPEELLIRYQLGLYGITVNKCPCIPGRTDDCTDVKGLNKPSIDRLIRLRTYLGCPFMITGGSETDGHKEGLHSHLNGYKVDICPTACVTNEICRETPTCAKPANYCIELEKDPDPVTKKRKCKKWGTYSKRHWQGPEGIIFAREEHPDHWDIDLSGNSTIPGCTSLMRLKVETITSGDPNDKVGANANGAERWLSVNEPLRYTIFFENKPDATADAQDVIVTDQLDPKKIELSTLKFELATFDHKIIASQPNPNSLTGNNEFNAQVDLRPARELVVNINATLDQQSGLLTWRFNTIDPATRQPPPLEGFLPPSKEGSVSFTVMPKKDLPTGTQIKNKASIKFDFNDPLITPEWFNTLDNTKPTSRVQALNATLTTPSFTVKWTGQDDGTGVQDYTVYVAENGGAFTAWLTNTMATEAMFTGQVGKSYSFYSIARDQVGHVENAKTTAEATTMIVDVPQGYEADVSPRPDGNNNGSVTIADWTQLGRFVTGLDTAATGGEFQRADCAPKDTKGDGKMTIADWVQAGRYAAGLDPVVSVGGPTNPAAALGAGLAARFESGVKASPLLLFAPRMSVEAVTARTMRAVNANFTRGQIGTLQIALEAQGNENAAAFSLNFDPKVMRFLDATVGEGASGAAVQINAAQAANGRIGFALALPAGQQFAAGMRTVLHLRFVPNVGEGDVVTNISFGDQLLPREIVDAFAAPISSVYASGTITIRGRTVANVSAASYVGEDLAADSIATAFGTGLASMTAGAVSTPLPTTLGGVSVKIKDALGVERSAPLFFVSPTQINYQIPAGTADGIAKVTITNGLGEATAGLLNIGKVAPGLFAADASGKGYAAAEAVTVASNGTQTLMPVARFDAGQNKVVAVPIDVSSGTTVLVLYGTGLRQRSSLAQVKVKVGGVDTVVDYAGAQPTYAGLDQINVRLPQSLAGRGDILVELIADGKAANPVRIQIK